jgi:RES domain-containing protein
MTFYLITREIFSHDFSGNGGLKSFARWHDHLPVIYASVNSSTAILETLVHLHPDEIHNDLVIMAINAPDTLLSDELEIEQLPKDWNIYPGPVVLQKIGNAWLRSKSSLILYIPSAVDSFSKNILINPQHPDAINFTINNVKPFAFDNRLLSLFNK